jgi:UDP-glucose 4-epimerase
MATASIQAAVERAGARLGPRGKQTLIGVAGLGMMLLLVSAASGSGSTSSGADFGADELTPASSHGGAGRARGNAQDEGGAAKIVSVPPPHVHSASAHGAAPAAAPAPSRSGGGAPVFGGFTGAAGG